MLAPCLTDRLQCKRSEANETRPPDLPAHISEQAGILHQIQGPHRKLVTIEKDEHWRRIMAHTQMHSSVRRRRLEGPRRATRPVPLQVSEHRLHEPHIPPKHRRAVSGPPRTPAGDEGRSYGGRPSKGVDTGKLQQANTGKCTRSGSVCLDVINQTWSPMYDMINIFEAFLPHLLRYPNPSDPLNGEAAALMLRDPKGYESKVRGRLQILGCWRC